MQSDGKILFGGYFTKVNGVGRLRVARLNADGTLEADFLNSGVNSFIDSVAVQNDGKIVIGGVFTRVSGTSRNGIARLNANGTLDSGFQDGLLGANGTAYAVTIQNDGKALVGGSFAADSGIEVNLIRRLDTNGTLDSSFQSKFSGPNSGVYSIAVQSNDKVLLGG